MIIKFTPEERERLQAIRKSYDPEREALLLKIRDCTDKDERAQLRIQQQALFDRMDLELQAFSEQCQRERFAQITGGAAGIIAHAKEQAPMILEGLYNEVATYFEGNEEDIKAGKVFVSLKQGKLYLNANYAAKSLQDELKLHIEALKDNKEALQELFAFIIETVEDSSLTDSTEITDQQQRPMEVMRFRRSPLADITKYGFMNDKANAQLIQDDGIFQTSPNGQMQLLWNVNQAPQNMEQVPVYIALTYDGIEKGLSKKLNAYDNAVYNAVSNLYYYWHQENPQKPLYITPQEIWRTMNGKKTGGSKISNPSKAQVKKIRESIDKMRHIDFYMDISEEIKANYITLDDERLTGGYIKDYLLNCGEAGFYTEKGNTVQGYKVREEPILFTYNKAKQHILLVDYEMLDTTRYVSDSENVAEFKGYLLQQILLMKNAAESGNRFKRSNTILMDTIYKSTGIKTPEERLADKEKEKKEKNKEYKTEGSRQKELRRFRQADRQKIEGLLDAWKAKGWIKGYTILNSKNEPIKERQQAKGYSIRV